MMDHFFVTSGTLVIIERKSGGATRAERYYKFVAACQDIWRGVI